LTGVKNDDINKAMNDKKHIDKADPETVLLRKFKGPVIKKLKELAENRELSRLCREDLYPMKPGRLTELHTEKRELTPYYLGKLVKGGIVNLEQILEGRNFDDLPKEEQRLLQKIFMDDELVDAIARAQKRGVNLLQYIKQILGETE
jgi:hypothetical protein